jgi:hypothetical protein
LFEVNLGTGTIEKHSVVEEAELEEKSKAYSWVQTSIF